MRGIWETEHNAVRPVAKSSARGNLRWGNLRCNVERPVRDQVADRPEHVEAAALLPSFSVRQLRRRRGEAAGANCPFRPQGEEVAKRVYAQQVSLDG